MWTTRLPSRAGTVTSGRLTLIEVPPVVTYSLSLPATYRPMLTWASWVDPPTCGVRMTFGRPWSGDTKRSPALLGSVGWTSTAAPARWPERSASARALWSKTEPRERLRKNERGRIAANSSSPKKPVFSGRPSTCSETTSTRESSSSRVSQRWALPMARRSWMS